MKKNNKLPWKSIKMKVAKTVRDIYKEGTSFASTRDVAMKMYQNKILPDANYKETIRRVTTVMKDHMKWQIFSNNTKGRVFIVPNSWW